MINFNPTNQVKQFHVGAIYAMHPTYFAFRLYNYYFSIKMDIPFNQIKHSQSFHKNGYNQFNHNAPSEKTMFSYNCIT
jgi:hypothetical protein